MNKKYIGIGLAILVVLVTIGVTLNQLSKNQDVRQRASGEKVILSYAPPQIQVAPNTEFLLDLKARTSTNTVNVSGIQTTIKFDQTKLELVRYEAGSRSSLFRVLYAGMPNNAAGTMILVLDREATTTIATGDINLGKLVFKTKTTTGPTEITAINSIVTERLEYANIIPGVEVATITIGTSTTVPTNTPVPPTATTAPAGSTATPISYPTKCTETNDDSKMKGDANCDGKVGMLDFLIWKGEYMGLDSTKRANFDYYFNTNTVVELRDLMIWRATCISNRTECNAN